MTGVFSFIQSDVRRQSIDDTLRVLTYEVGRMNELVHKGKVYGTKPGVAKNVPEFLLKHQTADALSMLRMFCEHMKWDESEMRTLGEERYMGRMANISEYGLCVECGREPPMHNPECSQNEKMY